MSGGARAGELRVGIGSLGTVGMEVARRLDAGIEGLRLTAVSARDTERATQRAAALKARPVVVALGELAEHADVVVECAPAEVFREVAQPAVAAGRTFVCISVGALLTNMDLVDVARASGARIVVPSGAIPGLDAVRAVAEDPVESIHMVTRKPPRGLAGAPGIPADVDLDNLTEAVRVFAGNAAEGAALFPANVNVAAALGLAGIGPERTRLEIWADPAVTRNLHTIVVKGESANLELSIESNPTAENPRTGRIVAPSVISALRRLVAPLTVGT